MLERRIQKREMCGFIYSEHVWCILFKLVLEKFQFKLRMADLLTSIVKPKSPMAMKGFDYFSELYRYLGVFNKENFILCKNAAFTRIAFFYAEHLKMKQLEYDEYIVKSLRVRILPVSPLLTRTNSLFPQSDAFRLEIQSCLGELLQYIDKLAPCESIFPNSEDKIIHCTQERLCHGNNHRSSEKVFGKSSFVDNKSFRFMQGMKSWIGIGYRPTWTGTHYFSYDTTLDEDIFHCISTIDYLTNLVSFSLFIFSTLLLIPPIPL